jgi:hypothetical protein
MPGPMGQAHIPLNGRVLGSLRKAMFCVISPYTQRCNFRHFSQVQHKFTH